jgi:phage nucleotide-binding protein
MAGYKITQDVFTSKINILIYGDPGAGKTYLAGTAQDVPEMQNVHFFNIDGGLMTLASRGGDITATDIHSVDDLEREFFKVANHDPEYSGVKTVVIDNISELLTLALEEATTREFAARVKKNKNYSIDEVYLEDYSVAGKKLARILRGFRDLPLNVIYLAHKKDKMRKGTNTLEASTPNLTDKLCVAVCGYMDFVGYLYTADEQVEHNGQYQTVMHRYLLTQPMNNYVAKIRNDIVAERLGAFIQDPTFTKIYDAYKGI